MHFFGIQVRQLVEIELIHKICTSDLMEKRMIIQEVDGGFSFHLDELQIVLKFSLFVV